MHEAVRAVFKDIIAVGGAPPDAAKLNTMITDACAAQGLGDHGYLPEYHALALTMIQYFLSTRSGRQTEQPTALRISFGAEEITVLPDDVLIDRDGSPTFRRVQTGHQRSTDGKDIGAAAFVMAAQQAFRNSQVELVHLADQATMTVEFNPKPLETKRKNLVDVLGAIRAGRFPPNPSTFTCPGCPAFFICGPAPAGPLQKKFS